MNPKFPFLPYLNHHSLKTKVSRSNPINFNVVGAKYETQRWRGFRKRKGYLSNIASDCNAGAQ
jgi:hypothetical protein